MMGAEGDAGAMGDRGLVGAGMRPGVLRARGDGAPRSLIRDELVRAVRELFPAVDGARVQVRRKRGGGWEIAFSCACPARLAEVCPWEENAATQVESVTSVALARIFGRVAVEHAAAWLDPETDEWRLRVLMTA